MSSTVLYNEKELLAAIAKGEEKAFNEVFHFYRDRLFHYLLGVTKSQVVAEDILVDVFMKLWVGREMLVNVQSLNAFLHKVAYNKAMDFFNLTARHKRLQQVYLDRVGQPIEKQTDELVIDNELRGLLHEAINQLPPQRKLIYQLSRQEGLTHDQIADALHLSPNTVRNSIIAANRSIAKFLQKYYPGKAALTLFFFHA